MVESTKKWKKFSFAHLELEMADLRIFSIKIDL